MFPILQFLYSQTLITFLFSPSGELQSEKKEEDIRPEIMKFSVNLPLLSFSFGRPLLVDLVVLRFFGSIDKDPHLRWVLGGILF